MLRNQKNDPNYYYHWVRDAAIAFEALHIVYVKSDDPQQKQSIRQKLNEYLAFTAQIQNLDTQAGLGEPKFNVDGSAFNGPWGRPQNDGPALRAISLTHWAQTLLATGEETFVREKIYDHSLPATLPLKKDLEYISHHWKDSTFDLWEEVKGTHFYTLMVTRRALLEGAALAEKLKDTGAAQWYQLQAKEIELELQKFWDPLRGYFLATINREDGADYKSSNLDTAVILGLLHGDRQDGFFAWNNPQVLQTLNKLIETNAALYAINQKPGILGYAIGRYPEDRYNGADFDGGNPWPLCTLAIAEALYRYAAVLAHNGQAKRAEEIAIRADEFVERVKFHAYVDGSLSEQIDRTTGYMTSAQDLTWNYAALISTIEAANWMGK